MDLKQGYKKTEMGIIPSDWIIVELNELIDSSRSIRYGIVQPGKFDPNGRFMIRGQDYSFGWVNSDQIFKVSPEVELKYRNARVIEGDIILTIVGAGTGNLEIIPKRFSNSNITQTTARIAIDPTKAFSKYCKYYLQSDIGKKEINLYIKGAAQPGLNIRDVKIFKLAIPSSKSEQTAIATALSDTDALITSLEKLIDKKRKIKQGVMQRLLKPKEGWSVCILNEACELITKGTTPTSIGREFQNTGISFIKIESITRNGRIIKDKIAFIDSYTNLLLKRSQLKSGDLLFSIAGALGRVAIVSKDILPANTNQALAIIRLKDDSKIQLIYLFHFLNSEKVQRLIINTSVQGAQANLSLQNIAELPIEFPSMSEQLQIGKVIHEMDLELEILLHKLNKIKAIKSGMMQNLLTGKIRLVKKEELKEA